jgi:hypothetical protein
MESSRCSSQKFRFSDGVQGALGFFQLRMSCFSFGNTVLYCDAITLLGSPSNAYWATAASFSAHRIKPTGGFSPGNVQFVFRVIQVKVHLPNVRVRERSDFQVDQNQASQSTVIKHQVNTVPSMTYPQPLLPGNKRKIAT